MRLLELTIHAKLIKWAVVEDGLLTSPADELLGEVFVAVVTSESIWSRVFQNILVDLTAFEMALPDERFLHDFFMISLLDFFMNLLRDFLIVQLFGSRECGGPDR